jgi:hypothetical protein
MYLFLKKSKPHWSRCYEYLGMSLENLGCESISSYLEFSLGGDPTISINTPDARTPDFFSNISRSDTLYPFAD